MQLLLVVLGGILAIAGGILGHLMESQLRRRSRRNELVAEREIDACAHAYRVFKEVVSFVDGPTPDFPKARDKFRREEGWFWDNRLWLPGRSPDAWIGCRNAVQKSDRGTTIALANRGIDEIYDLLRLKKLEPERLTG